MTSEELFDQPLLDKIGELLIRRKETIAVAESVTSGALQLAFSSIKNATNFFQGGITAYNAAQKYKHLCVEPIHATQVNCVSERVAGQLALHVCRSFTSDWGLSVTGYASPVPESENKLFAYFAVTHHGSIIREGKMDETPEDSTEIQFRFTRRLLAILAEEMEKAG